MVRTSIYGRYVRIDGRQVQGPSLAALVQRGRARPPEGDDGEARDTLAAARRLKDAGRDEGAVRPDDRPRAIRRVTRSCRPHRRPGGPDQDLRADRGRAQAQGDQVRRLRQPGQAGRGPQGAEEVSSRLAMQPAREQHWRRSVALARRLPRAGAAAGVLVGAAAALSLLAGALGAQSPDQPAPAGEPIDRAALLAPATDFSAPETNEELPGGAATSRQCGDAQRILPSLRQPDLRAAARLQSRERRSSGSSGCPPPSSTMSSDGLGPLFNARSLPELPPQGWARPSRRRALAGWRRYVDAPSAVACPPQTDAERLAIDEGRQAVVPEPTYGDAASGLRDPRTVARGRVRITYEDRPVALDGGPVVHLQRPTYRRSTLATGRCARTP